MKQIDLASVSPTLPEILQLANEENIILRTLEGRQYVLAEIDDFGEEIEAVVRNKTLMKLLDARSKESRTYNLTEAREKLQGSGQGTAQKKRKR
jgi:hypothetical protein